jgi:hypothetical protein
MKNDSSLLRRGPGRPKKQKSMCSNLNPETESPEEPDIKEKNESMEKVE